MRSLSQKKNLAPLFSDEISLPEDFYEHKPVAATNSASANDFVFSIGRDDLLQMADTLAQTDDSVRMRAHVGMGG